MSYYTYNAPTYKQTTFEYIYDSNLVITGGNPSDLSTGGFRPLRTTDFGSTSISGNFNLSTPVITYTPTFGSITGGQVIIPTGTKKYSYYVESGSAYLNGLLLNQGISIAGGGYGGLSLTTMTIGCTGGLLIYSYEY